MGGTQGHGGSKPTSHMKNQQTLPAERPRTELEWALVRLMHGDPLPEPYRTAYLNQHNPEAPSGFASDPRDATWVRRARIALAKIVRDETDRFTPEQKVDAIEHDCYLDGTLPPKQLLAVHHFLARAFLRKCGFEVEVEADGET